MRPSEGSPIISCFKASTRVHSPHHLTEVLELILQASEEVAIVGVHAHLPELVVVRAVALIDAPLPQTEAQSSDASKSG